MSNLLKTISFADYTTCFYSHKDIDMLCEIVNNELREVCNWFKANKLSLNAKKKRQTWYSFPNQKKNDDRYIIHFDDCNRGGGGGYSSLVLVRMCRHRI